VQSVEPIAVAPVGVGVAVAAPSQFVLEYPARPGAVQYEVLTTFLLSTTVITVLVAFPKTRNRHQHKQRQQSRHFRPTSAIRVRRYSPQRPRN